MIDLTMPTIERITEAANKQKQSLFHELGWDMEKCTQLTEGDVRIVLEAAHAAERGE